MSYLSQIIETEVLHIWSVKTTNILPNIVGAVYGLIVNYIIERGEEPLGIKMVSRR